MLNIISAAQETSLDSLINTDKQVATIGVVSELTLGNGGNFYEGLPRQGFVLRRAQETVITRLGNVTELTLGHGKYSVEGYGQITRPRL